MNFHNQLIRNPDNRPSNKEAMQYMEVGQINISLRLFAQIFCVSSAVITMHIVNEAGKNSDHG